MAKQQNEIEKMAIHLVDNERMAWDYGVAQVTDRVAFDIRNLIRLLRKNYWSVFDSPIDKITGRKKIFIPLTESVVETSVKNFDLDTKDINVRARHPGAVGTAHIMRAVIKNKLDNMYFGEMLDMFERQMAIDGTAVWKTVQVWNREGKREMKVFNVDLLNVYIDPTAPSIQEAYRFTERSLMTEDEIMSMKGWMNTEGIRGTDGLHRYDRDLSPITGAQQTGRYVDVWEMWGKIPKFLITGEKEDMDVETEGQIVVSGLDHGGTPTVHLIKENKSGLKPYEEAWYTRIPGRWYGRGVAEKIMMLQLWMNIVVNIRINRSYVSQLGIFKIKRNRGITPQMVSRLASNGAILVQDQDDIEQMVMQDASPASYRDEQQIQTWAERVTSAFEIVTGETLPATTSATATALQSRSAQSAFALIRKGLGMFLQRWLERHAVPKILENMTKEEMVRITGDINDLKILDERIVFTKAIKKLTKLHEQGIVFDEAQAKAEIRRAIARQRSLGEDRYRKLITKLDIANFEIKVFVTNEEVDKAVMVQNLLTALQMAPEFKEQILDHVFDFMGLRLKKPETNFGAPEEAAQRFIQSFAGQLQSNAQSPKAADSVGPGAGPNLQTQASTLLG